MSKPVVVAESPNKNSIKYSVLPKSSTIEEAFDPLMEEVQQLYSGAMDIVGMSVTQQMCDYCNLKESCRRAFLLQDFDADEHPPVRSASVVTLYPIMQLC